MICAVRLPLPYVKPRQVTEKEVQQLDFLGQQLALAKADYEGRSHKGNARELRMAFIHARIWYRFAWSGAMQAAGIGR